LMLMMLMMMMMMMMMGGADSDEFDYASHYSSSIPLS